MSLRTRTILAAFGGGVGLAVGALWYYAWGCDRCADGRSVLEVIVFTVACGAVLANVWGKDHVRSRIEP